MDTLSGLDNEMLDAEQGDAEVDTRDFDIGTDERRMHVRAYNHWVSLLRGRAYPLIADLDADNIADFGPHSVLLDFSGGMEDPSIAFLGNTLREECGLDQDVTKISDVPGRSLLSRLTDHYLQIIANRAPIGFEAEFVSTRGHNTLYRGILMPFTSGGETIDYIYGVINWKELVDAATQARLQSEVDAAVRNAPKIVPTAPVWADGPRAEAPVAADPVMNVDTQLADRLMLARETAAAARAADTRSRAALYRALGRAHDFAIATEADPAGYAALLAETGLTLQERAPLTPIVKLVFGADYDKTRVTEFAAVLAYARRCGVAAGGLPQLIETVEGGIKGIVAAERAVRRPLPKPARTPKSFASRPSLATITLDTGAEEGAVVLLIARAAAGGTLEIVGTMDEPGIAARAVRKLR